MGVDCALLLRYVDGVRDVHLDRLYCFDGFPADRWLSVSDAKDKLQSLLDMADTTTYGAYWYGYALACLEQLVDERVLLVGIFSEQHPIHIALMQARDVRELPYDTHEVLKVGENILNGQFFARRLRPAKSRKEWEEAHPAARFSREETGELLIDEAEVEFVRSGCYE